MSEKIITIDGKEVALRASGATYIKYRNAFKEDLFIRMEEIGKEITDGVTLPEGAVDTMLKAMYIMAVQADKNNKLNFEDWLDQFSMMGPLEGIQGVYELLLGDQATLDEPKKKEEEQSAE